MYMHVYARVLFNKLASQIIWLLRREWLLSIKKD